MLKNLRARKTLKMAIKKVVSVFTKSKQNTELKSERKENYKNLGL